MKFRIVITLLAAEDARNTARWIAVDSPQNAAEWYAELFDQISTLASMPRRFAAAPESVLFGMELRHFIHKSYRVIYRVGEAEVVVLRIWHASRLPLTSDELNQ